MSANLSGFMRHALTESVAAAAWMAKGQSTIGDDCGSEACMERARKLYKAGDAAMAMRVWRVAVVSYLWQDGGVDLSGVPNSNHKNGRLAARPDDLQDSAAQVRRHGAHCALVLFRMRSLMTRVVTAKSSATLRLGLSRTSLQIVKLNGLSLHTHELHVSTDNNQKMLAELPHRNRHLAGHLQALCIPQRLCSVAR